MLIPTSCGPPTPQTPLLGTLPSMIASCKGNLKNCGCLSSTARMSPTNRHDGHRGRRRDPAQVARLISRLHPPSTGLGRTVTSFLCGWKSSVTQRRSKSVQGARERTSQIDRTPLEATSKRRARPPSAGLRKKIHWQASKLPHGLCISSGSSCRRRRSPGR